MLKVKLRLKHINNERKYQGVRIVLINIDNRSVRTILQK